MILGTNAKPPRVEPVPIHVEGLHKSYQSGTAAARVLTGVDLVVRRGRCVYLVGPSGSGKTTLLSILGCILSPDRGLVRILGQDLRQLRPKELTALRRDRLGFVFQRFHLIRGLTALENVCVPLTLAGFGPRAASKRGRVLLETVGLGGRAKSHPARLSAGECQRVALARALARDPELILADEPTASLDAANGQEILRLFRRLTIEQGKTAVVVTHDPRIFCFADQVFRLENGRVVETCETSPAVRSEEGT